MGTYTLKDEVGMVVVRVTLRNYLRRGRCVGNLKWDIMRQEPTPWDNLYGAIVLGVGETILQRAGIFPQRRCAICVDLVL